MYKSPKTKLKPSSRAGEKEIAQKTFISYTLGSLA
jgi:hypothetical protein